MELILYPLLSTRSRRALLRRVYRQSQHHYAGQPYHYNPRSPLLERLSEQTGLSIQQVAIQLLSEREYLLSLED